MKKYSRYSNPHKRKFTNYLKYGLGGFLILGLVVVTLIATNQLQVVREFFSRASGYPADLTINTQGILGPMPRPWRYFAQGGEEHAWRIAELTPHIKALHPEYIRLDHIYDFYDIVKGTPGNINFDFSQFDLVLDDITATGAKPYIALSYMPPAISKGDIVDVPVRWEDWQLTIQKTIEHVSGTRQIPDVYYEVWNEPDLFGGWKYYGAKNYLTLYNYAAYGANNARGVLPFKFGGPGITALYKNWFNALAKNAIKNNVRYDFFSWHRYNQEVSQFETDMTEANQWLSKFPQLEPTLELHITEWGHDSENHPGYDNNYSAAHTVASSISMLNKVQKAFVFEIQDGKDAEGNEHWGRWGMFTHKDFGSKPKPRYNALKMLDSIADQRLQILGQGSWVKAIAAKNEAGNVEMIIANFDKYGAHSENASVTFNNIDPGEYYLEIQYLDGRHSSKKVATDAATLKTFVPMKPNDVAFAEFIKAESVKN